LSYGRSQARGCSGRPPKRQEARAGVPNPPDEPKEGQGAALKPARGRCPLDPRQRRGLWTPSILIEARQGGLGQPGLPRSHRPTAGVNAAAQAGPVPPAVPQSSEGFQGLRPWRESRGQRPLAGSRGSALTFLRLTDGLGTPARASCRLGAQVLVAGRLCGGALVDVVDV